VKLHRHILTLRLSYIKPFSAYIQLFSLHTGLLIYQILIMNVDPSAMTVNNLRQELESLGIDTRSFLEKSEFVDALVTARKGAINQRRLSTPVAIDAVPGLFVQTEFFSHDVENSLYNEISVSRNSRTNRRTNRDSIPIE
jgi:hypothetical protein